MKVDGLQFIKYNIFTFNATSSLAAPKNVKIFVLEL